MEEKIIKVGVIGTGSIAKVAHFPSLIKIPGIELTSVMSGHYENAVKAKESYGFKNAAHDMDEFLKQDLDCAFLLTPKTQRREFLLPMLEANLVIFCEKPLATTLEECEYLADASANSGCLVMVGFNRRFSTVNNKAIQAFNGVTPDFVFAEKCREFREYRGTLENAIHMVDLLRYICGEPVTVEAHAKFTDPFYEDLCTAQICFDSGAVGLLGASRQAGQWREHIEMYGNDMNVIVDTPDTYRVVYKDHEYVENMTPLCKGWANVEEKMGFKPCIEHFINCVRTREKPLTNAEDAYKTHLLMNEILRISGLPDMTKDWSKA